MLSMAVQRMMKAKGFKVVAYLDDYFVIENSYNECRQGWTLFSYYTENWGFQLTGTKLLTLVTVSPFGLSSLTP